MWSRVQQCADVRLPSTEHQEGKMRRYVQVSGAFFGLLAAVQLTRTVMGWPVQVASMTVPVWVSGIAFIIAITFASWAWRATRDAA
jgi:hypothetical protein